MYKQICCFTGHRVIPTRKFPAIQKRLKDEITSLIHRGVRYFKAGGALGFDTMAAQTILGLKAIYPHIWLILVLPCKEQAKWWTEKDKKIYNQILNKADKVVYTSEHYYNGCMHKRNRHLIDNSVFCICYLNEKSGGTAYTVDYARKKGLQVINLA